MQKEITIAVTTEMNEISKSISRINRVLRDYTITI